MQVVTEAIDAGVKSIWLQPGAESTEALAYAQKHNVDIIANGPCLLVALRAGKL
jgi:predicted CoA-binding protein